MIGTMRNRRLAKGIIVSAAACALCAGAVFLGACSNAGSSGANQTNQTAQTMQTAYVAPPTFTADLDASQTAVAPRVQDDYYLSTNFDWLKNTQIEPSKSNASPFQTLRTDVRDSLQQISEECAAAQQQGSLAADSDEYRIASAYRCALDMDGRNAAGLGPMDAPLRSVYSATTLQGYEQAIGELAGGSSRVSILGSFSVSRASNRQGVYTVCLKDPELFMSKTYYASDDYAKYQAALKTYIAQMLVLYGYPADTAAQRTDDVYAMLTSFAAASLDQKQRYDPNLSSNIMDWNQLRSLYGNVDMQTLLHAARICPDDGVDTWEVTSLDEAAVLNGMFTDDNLEALKAYSIAVSLDGVGEYLGTDYRSAYLTFHNTITGVAEQDTDESMATGFCEKLMETPYGKQYVQRSFSPDSKAYVTELAHSILGVYRQRLAASTWLSDSAKETAYDKLDQMAIKIGYPDNWEIWLDGVVLQSPEQGGTLIGNVLAVESARLAYDRSRIDQPVDRGEWDMSPQTVNAYYDPTMNEIVFPAGILQTPFYDPSASRAQNLGGIGMVIAHEVSHSFDDNGCEYDETGAVRDWWTEADHAAFSARTAAYVAYYSRYELWPGNFEDGAKTLGENIADSTGIACICDIMADEAGMRTSYGTGTDPAEASPANQAAYKANLQDMFRAYSAVWRTKYRDAYRDKLLTSDVHSFGYVRTDAVLSSCDSFYYAYDVHEGDGMYVAPESRIGVW